jgi:AAA+ superfamily predicted ATPase
MKLFAHINDIADDDACLVVVLIDEIESISASRSSASRSNEPGDAVRVVNAVLTSLDALKRRNNVLVLCTSNMVDSLDAVSVLISNYDYVLIIDVRTALYRLMHKNVR